MFRKLSNPLFSVLRAVKKAWYARRILIDPINTIRYFTVSSSKPDHLCKFQSHGLPFYSRSLDWHAVDEVILRGEYNEGLSFLKELKQPVVIDLGANIGAFSIQTFVFNPGAIVHSVEPSLATYHILEKNRLANSTLNWFAYRNALWDRDAMIGFEENSQASTSSHISQSENSIRVPAIRLKTLVEKHVRAPIDLIKMDIEGAEEVVLFDCPDVLSAINTLILEIHPHRCNEKKIRELLHKMFPYVYEITGRLLRKPLLVASQSEKFLKHAARLVE